MSECRGMARGLVRFLGEANQQEVLRIETAILLRFCCVYSVLDNISVQRREQIEDLCIVLTESRT